MGLMWLWWLVVAVVVVVAVWAIARSVVRGGSGRESPEELLKRRYASGEIDRAEYERALQDLRR